VITFWAAHDRPAVGAIVQAKPVGAVPEADGVWLDVAMAGVQAEAAAGALVVALEGNE
jgi:hypothetical protein